MMPLYFEKKNHQQRYKIVNSYSNSCVTWEYHMCKIVSVKIGSLAHILLLLLLRILLLKTCIVKKKLIE